MFIDINYINLYTETHRERLGPEREGWQRIQERTRTPQQRWNHRHCDRVGRTSGTVTLSPAAKLKKKKKKKNQYVL